MVVGRLTELESLCPPGIDTFHDCTPRQQAFARGHDLRLSADRVLRHLLFERQISNQPLQLGFRILVLL